jgi:hypothetical protein
MAGPEQVKSITLDVVVRIGSGLAGRQGANESRNAGVATMFERRDGPGAHVRTIVFVEGHLQKVGLQFREPAFFGDDKCETARGEAELAVGDEGPQFGGQAGVIEFGVRLGVAVRRVGDLFALDRAEQRFDKRRSVAVVPAGEVTLEERQRFVGNEGCAQGGA